MAHVLRRHDSAAAFSVSWPTAPCMDKSRPHARLAAVYLGEEWINMPAVASSLREQRGAEKMLAVRGWWWWERPNATTSRCRTAAAGREIDMGDHDDSESRLLSVNDDGRGMMHFCRAACTYVSSRIRNIYWRSGGYGCHCVLEASREKTPHFKHPTAYYYYYYQEKSQW